MSSVVEKKIYHVPEFNQEKISDKPKLRHILYNNGTVLFKNSNVMKDKRG